MGSQNVIDYRKRRKQNLIRVCGGKCCLCGYNKIQAALEFHHLIPEEKSYSIGSKGLCHKIEDDIFEIKKCILVCANCHREIHEGLYELSYLQEKQVFDEEYIAELTTYKKDKIFYCKNCGIEITKDSSTGLCAKCAAETRRSVERPSKEELYEKIVSLKGNFTKAGQFYKITDNGVRKWCKSYGLPYRSSDYKNIE